MMRSSGNVFYDLNIENPETKLLKVDIAQEIQSIINDDFLEKNYLSKLLSLTVKEVEEIIMTNKLSNLSLEDLLSIMGKIGYGISLELFWLNDNARLRFFQPNKNYPYVNYEKKWKHNV